MIWQIIQVANESDTNSIQSKIVETSGKGNFSDFCKIKEAVTLCENSPWMHCLAH